MHRLETVLHDAIPLSMLRRPTRPWLTFGCWMALACSSAEPPAPVPADGGGAPAADLGPVGSLVDGGGGPPADGGAAETDAGAVAETRPNILLIIADDLGVDASAQYPFSSDLPSTPTIDGLAAEGIVFENAWATPACTTTRGTLISGLHGVRSGVSFVPAVMADDTLTLHRLLESQSPDRRYRTAIFGKWHLGGPNPAPNHPNTFGVQTYAGNVGGNLEDYSSWSLTQEGTTTTSTRYHTSHITDLAVDWVGQQSEPWFLWVAYSAPHSPFHLPPSHLHQRNLSGTPEDIEANRRTYFLAAIEAMDAEIGRLLASLDPATRENTVIVFIGDNGTPRPVIDRSVFIGSHGKNSLYEGGVRVPMVVSGPGARRGVRETALLHSADIFATVAELAEVGPPADLNGRSFVHLLRGLPGTDRTHNYTEFESQDVTGWATRNTRYKLIRFSDGRQELYDLSVDLGETQNLLETADDYSAILQELTAVADAIRQEPGAEPTDITGAVFSSRARNCRDYMARYRSTATDVARAQTFMGSTSISISGTKCVVESNAIPNHDFNDGARAFPNLVQTQTARFEFTAEPAVAAAATPLSLQVDNAVLLNGVKVDVLAAGCFGVGNGRIGCNDPNQPWRYDPLSSGSGFNVDSHNAHTQPDGHYHYHGPPNALFPDSAGMASGVVGFAADGFPIFGSYFDDGGQIRKARPSYRLRTGLRPTGADQPGGTYDGTFRDDYEYVPGFGDLDECNGMMIEGAYGYFITDGFPYVLGCFRGTPDPSFTK